MSTQQPEPVTTEKTWRSPWKWVIGAAVLVHMVAVAITPLHYASRNGPNTSPLLDVIELPLRPYTQAAFLNHGYAFFSPEPGSSRLIRYRLTLPGGEKIEKRFPDIKRHWPRLLYHRYFMLSEQSPVYVPASPEPAPRKGDPGYAEDMLDWQLYETERKRARFIYVHRWEAMKQHLRATHNAKEVELMRIEHMLPTPDDVLGGMTLTDKRLYREMPETAGFEPETPPAAPQPTPLPAPPGKVELPGPRKLIPISAPGRQPEKLPAPASQRRNGR